MKSLKHCIKLKSNIKIYVPSTQDIKEPIDNNVFVDETLKLLAGLFGGATATKSLGAWITGSGELAKESVSMVFAFANQADLEKHIETIYDHCLKLKKDMAQESIALEVNGELYLI